MSTTDWPVQVNISVNSVNPVSAWATTFYIPNPTNLRWVLITEVRPLTQICKPSLLSLTLSLSLTQICKLSLIPINNRYLRVVPEVQWYRLQKTDRRSKLQFTICSCVPGFQPGLSLFSFSASRRLRCRSRVQIGVGLFQTRLLQLWNLTCTEIRNKTETLKAHTGRKKKTPALCVHAIRAKRACFLSEVTMCNFTVKRQAQYSGYCVYSRRSRST